MSDARPITNITDFVCGSCWNSFSRSDPGVVRGNELACPHCGHVLPLEGASDVAHVVRSALPMADSDSTGYPCEGPALADAPGFPPLDGQLSYGWGGGNSRPISEDAGFMVGEPDDFGVDEATLRPDINHLELLALVRAAPRQIEEEEAFGSAVASGFVAGDEMAADVDEPTPFESDERVRRALAKLQAGHPDGGATDPASVPQAVVFAAGLGDDTGDGVSRDTLGKGGLDDLDPALVAALNTAEEPRLEEKDWKLKAMGLTYNFHGLDALIGWASNKAGQPLSIAMDGSVWKDFGTFFEGYKAGLGAQNAFDEAAEPGAVRPPGPRTHVTGTMKALAQPPELSRPGAPGMDDKTAPQAPGVGALGSTGSSRTVPAVTGLTTPNVTNKNPGLAPGKSIGPASSPSRRTPVAAAKPVTKEATSPAKIAVAVAVLAVLLVVVLHVLGVFRIPGLGS